MMDGLGDRHLNAEEKTVHAGKKRKKRGTPRLLTSRKNKKKAKGVNEKNSIPVAAGQIAVKITNATRLHQSCEHGDAPGVKKLLEDATTQHLLKLDASRDTPLHNAISNGHLACAMMILDHPELTLPDEMRMELVDMCSTKMGMVRAKLLAVCDFSDADDPLDEDSTGGELGEKMNSQDVEIHIVSYPDVKEPQKQLIEKHSSPKKSNVLSFNPDGSLCIPAELKDKLVQKPTKSGPSKLNLSRTKPRNRNSVTMSASLVPKISILENDANDDQVEQLSTTSGVESPSSKENITPCSGRKRKKKCPPLAVSSKKSIINFLRPPEGYCHFCYTDDSNKELGEMKKTDGILAHYSCMLFSSGLCQSGKNDEGMWGFLLPDIKKELSRGKRLRCSFCRQPGALVGCYNAKCPNTYHFTCGTSNGALMQYYDSFRSYCSTHRPLQYNPLSMIGQVVDCPICGDEIRVEQKVVPHSVLVTECCSMTPIHRACIQRQADASGYFFRCPMCNNEKKYNSIMKIMGIHIPQSDAAWERDGYFDDLLEEYWRCDVPICLNPDGRKTDSRNRDKWDLMKCSICGQAGAHPACLGYDKRGPKDWNCRSCLEFEAKFERERLKELTKLKEEGVETPGPSREHQQSVQEPTKAPAPPKRNQLSPSKNPFLMTPDVLKEAVFKLCVSKLKMNKVLDKNLDPNNWTAVIPQPEEYSSSDDEEDMKNLKAKKFCLLLIRGARCATETILVSSDSETETEPYNEHKEKQWELVLKRRKELLSKDVRQGNGSGKKIVPIPGQMSISSFFKPKLAVTEVKVECKEEVASHDSKKRKLTSEKVTIKCTICNKTFFSHELKDHVQREHDRVTPFRCYFCDRTFDTVADCVGHMKNDHIPPTPKGTGASSSKSPEHDNKTAHNPPTLNLSESTISFPEKSELSQLSPSKLLFPNSPRDDTIQRRKLECEIPLLEISMSEYFAQLFTDEQNSPFDELDSSKSPMNTPTKIKQEVVPRTDIFPETPPKASRRRQRKLSISPSVYIPDIPFSVKSEPKKSHIKSPAKQKQKVCVKTEKKPAKTPPKPAPKRPRGRPFKRLPLDNIRDAAKSVILSNKDEDSPAPNLGRENIIQPNQKSDVILSPSKFGTDEQNSPFDELDSSKSPMNTPTKIKQEVVPRADIFPETPPKASRGRPRKLSASPSVNIPDIPFSVKSEPNKSRIKSPAKQKQKVCVKTEKQPAKTPPKPAPKRRRGRPFKRLPLANIRVAAKSVILSNKDEDSAAPNLGRENIIQPNQKSDVILSPSKFGTRRGNKRFIVTEVVKTKAYSAWDAEETRKLIALYEEFARVHDGSLVRSVSNKIATKLGRPGPAVFSKWRHLKTRYNQERAGVTSGPIWRYLSDMAFLDKKHTKDARTLGIEVEVGTVDKKEDPPSEQTSATDVSTSLPSNVASVSASDVTSVSASKVTSSVISEQTDKKEDLELDAPKEETSTTIAASAILSISASTSVASNVAIIDPVNEAASGIENTVASGIASNVAIIDPVNEKDLSKEETSTSSVILPTGLASMVESGIASNVASISTSDHVTSNSGISSDIRPVQESNEPGPSTSSGNEERCTECNKEFASSTDLEHHKRQLRFFCRHCQKNCTSLEQLRSHHRTMSDENKAGICEFCGVKSTPRELDRHIQEHHLDKWITYSCLVCGVTVRRKQGAVRHVWKKHGVDVAVGGTFLNYISLRDYRCMYD